MITFLKHPSPSHGHAREAQSHFILTEAPSQYSTAKTQAANTELIDSLFFNLLLLQVLEALDLCSML